MNEDNITIEIFNWCNVPINVGKIGTWRRVVPQTKNHKTYAIIDENGKNILEKYVTDVEVFQYWKENVYDKKTNLRPKQ